MWHGHDCRFGDVGMRDRGVFEVDRADPFAAGFDNVLPPVNSNSRFPERATSV
jgi:hypothetical protein